MTLNASGPISLAGTTVGQSIQKELGGTGTTQISLNDSNVRSLAGVASGAITMPTNFWGKSSNQTINLTVASNTTNYNVYTAAVAAGYSGGSATITVTINSGVEITSTSTGSPALTIPNSFGGTVTITITNNGYIVGKGGNNGGYAGGTGILASRAVSIRNNNIIGGGGGGGGDGYAYCPDCCVYCAGSGGGGGGYGIGANNGTITIGGNGGISTTCQNGSACGGFGGAAGIAGQNGNSNGYAWGGGGGGGIGAAGGTGYSPGGAAGSCTSGNSNITWLANGSRYGALN